MTSGEKDLAGPLLSRLRPEVRSIRAYRLEPHTASVKLDQNENSCDPPEAIGRAIRDALSQLDLNRYPPVQAAELKSALGRLNDWPAEGVLVGNGSNELLHMLALSTLERGRRVVYPTPSFIVYGYVSRMLGAEMVEVPLRADYTYDVDAFLAAIEKKKPSLVFLCSPNNPTGSTLSEADIERIAKECQGILVVDEAYFEFGGSAARELLPRYPHMVLSRTFSKAMGLAGLRIGYLLAAPELAEEVEKAQLPYALNGFSRAVALAVCDHYELIRKQVKVIVEERNALYSKLRDLDGIQPYPSEANFILFECDAGATRVFDSLLARGVLVRDLSSSPSPSLSRALRVTVGRPDENKQFLSALCETMEELR
jgi:histidinol-phosphate aminotransferase